MAFVLLLVLGYFISIPSSLAQTATPPTPTPELVVPKEEASEAVRPGETPPSLSSPTGESQSSLAGAFLSSYVAHNQGDLNEALLYLRQAYSKDPSNNHIGGQILVLNITTGQLGEAMTLARKLHKDEKHELIVDLLLAIDAIKQQDPARASTLLKEANSDSFDHIWLPLLLQWMQPPTKEATVVKTSDIVEGESSTPSFVHYHIALLNDLRGFTKEAEQHYQQAVADLARAPFRALLAYINLKARMDDRETIQQLLLDLQQQRPNMEKLLRQEVPYLNNLAGEQALPTEKFINNTEQGVAEVLLTMASMLYTLDVSQDIPLYLQMAIYLKPDFPTAQLMLGNYFESLELWNDAIAQYEHIRPTSPLYIKATIRRAYVMGLQGNAKAAKRVMKQLTSQFPTSMDVWIAAGDLARNDSEFEQAIRYYDKAIGLLNNQYSKHHWGLFFSRGACYERLGKIIEAERDLRQANNLSADQPEVLNYIGYMWLEQDKKVFEAVRMIEKAYKLNPNEPHIIDSMGWAFFKTGKLDKAIALLEHAAEMLPNDPTINEHLGDCYWHANRIIEARYQWKRAKDFSEDDKQTERLARKIDQGLSTYSFHTPPISTSNTKPATEANAVNAASASTIQ